MCTDWAADEKQQQRKQEQDTSSSDFHSETGLPSRIVTPFIPHTAEKWSLGPALGFCLTKGGDKACINLGYLYQIVATITGTELKNSTSNLCRKGDLLEDINICHGV